MYADYPEIAGGLGTDVCEIKTSTRVPFIHSLAFRRAFAFTGTVNEALHQSLAFNRALASTESMKPLIDILDTSSACIRLLHSRPPDSTPESFRSTPHAAGVCLPGPYLLYLDTSYLSPLRFLYLPSPAHPTPQIYSTRNTTRTTASSLETLGSNSLQFQHAVRARPPSCSSSGITSRLTRKRRELLARPVSRSACWA